MAYDAKAVANFFLARAKQEGKRLTPMQLIKLVYLAHGWHLAVHHRPLLNEPVQAWKFGPVIPSLYHEFKTFGNGAITRRATEFDSDQNKLVTPELHADAALQALLDQVWKVYSPLSGIQLSNLTHQTGTPWHTVWNKISNEGARFSVIPDNIIAAHFTELSQRNAARRQQSGTAASR